MSKEFDIDTKPSQPNFGREALGFVAETACTTSRRFRTIILKTLVFLFIFGLGFIISELRFTDQIYQMDNSHQFAYIYDTEEKIEDYYKMIERGFAEEMGLPPEHTEIKEFMAMVREQGRPLVVVGPFLIFASNDGNTFFVREIQSVKQEGAALFPLIMLEISDHAKNLNLYSSMEKGGRLPRFNANFIYSECGIYETGSVSLYRDGMVERSYFDSKGIGVFDVMNVFENGVWFIYGLNGLSWKLQKEQPYPESLKNLENGPLKDYHRLLEKRKPGGM